MKLLRNFFTGLLAVTVLVGAQLTVAQPFPIPTMIVTTSTFEDGGIIPNKNSFYGGSTQPDFKITGAPEDTVSYAIIFHDIDVSMGGTTNDVTHWVAWNIPSGDISEGGLPEGSIQGVNATSQKGYFGPGAPNTARYHHYVFEFYALNANLDLDDSADRDKLVAAMEGKIVGKAAYVGRFKKEDDE